MGMNRVPICDAVDHPDAREVVTGSDDLTGNGVGGAPIFVARPVLIYPAAHPLLEGLGSVLNLWPTDAELPPPASVRVASVIRRMGLADG